MKICIPSQDDRGLESEVHDHFGSAPWFTVVDTESGEAESFRNPSCHRDHGSCHHVDTLRSRGVAAVVSSGIGRRAWNALDEAGIKVFSATTRKVGDLVIAVQAGDAEPLNLDSTCQGHGSHQHGEGRGMGCGHGHGDGHGHGHGDGHGHGHGHGHGDGHGHAHVHGHGHWHG